MGYVARRRPGVRLTAAAAGLIAAVTMSGVAAAGEEEETCAVPHRPLLCRAYHVFRQEARRRDRLPRQFRDDPPLRLVNQSSSRVVGPGRPRRHPFYLLGGRRFLCLVDYDRRQGVGGYVCSHVRAALAGHMFLESTCEPPPRRHRLLYAQPMPDGVRRAVFRRVQRPRVRVVVRRNLLLADLRIPSRAYLPTRVTWWRHGRRRSMGLGVNESLLRCRAG
jgi:hypothetical protein